MNPEKILLYLEQYVHFEKNANSFFIYNEFNRFFWEQKNILDNALLELIDSLDKKTEETKIAELQKENLKNEQIKFFIKQIKQSFSGDVILLQNRFIPFVPRQNIHIYNDVEFMKVDAEYLFSYHAKLSVAELTINTSTCKVGYSANPQLFKESKIEKQSYSIYQFLPNIVKEVREFKNLRKVNVVYYADSLLVNIKEFVKAIRTVPVFIHVELKNLDKAVDSFRNKCSYCVYLNPSKNEVRSYDTLCSTVGYNIVPYVMIRNNDEIAQVDFLQQFCQSSLRLCPVYTDNNLCFFIDNFSKTLSDVLSLEPTIKEILTNRVLNRNFFGKVYISEQANISTLGEESELNLKKDSIAYHAYIEHRFKGKWFMTRQNVKPCSDCIYHNLCPPISKYEFLMNKYNFCNFPE